MIAVIIGVSLGCLVIFLFSLLKGFSQSVVYGLILAGIGFLYVGFTWSNMKELVITIVQAIVFFFISYYGIKKNIYFLAAGYFLHGTWDLAYNLFPNANLIPPHYDLFCLSIDFTMGFYLLLYQYRQKKKLVLIAG
ncbi:hypothetical protein BH10BAC3_BH10BAC3_19870 [soil metagenome]